MKREQLNELIYQMLETEHGGIQVYETALRCVLNDELKEGWEEYLEQTKNHERIVVELMEKMGLDPEEETPGRAVVRHTGESLVKAMELGLASGPPGAGEGVGPAAGGRAAGGRAARRVRVRGPRRDQGSPQLGAGPRSCGQGAGRGE